MRIDHEAKEMARWLGWPTRPDVITLCVRLSSGGKIERKTSSFDHTYKFTFTYATASLMIRFMDHFANLKH